jgi:hypothetical protein
MSWLPLLYIIDLEGYVGTVVHCECEHYEEMPMFYVKVLYMAEVVQLVEGLRYKS